MHTDTPSQGNGTEEKVVKRELFQARLEGERMDTRK